MTTTTDIKINHVLEIGGRRWFSRTYGSTYFTCIILVDGHEVYRTDTYEYGYDRMYEQWATDWLMKNDYLPKFTWGDSLSMYCREVLEIVLISHASDVNRRKDL